MNRKIKLPKLPNNWEIKKLSEVCPLQRGFDLPKNKIERGEFPVVYSNGILNFHSEYKVKGPGVVTGRSGTIGKITFVDENFWPHNTTLWVTNFFGNFPKFIYYLLQSFSFEKYNSGTSVPTLNRNDLHPVKVSIPPIPEQRKIAQVISVWDRAIENNEILIDSKVKLKQALMQQLLTGNLRFKEFVKIKFHKIELGEFLIPTPRPVPRPNSAYTALGIRSHGKGTFLKAVENPEVVMMDTLYEVKEDDLIVNITFAWEGAIAIVKKSDEGALVSHRFPTSTFNREIAIPEYFRHVIQTKRFVHELGLVSPGGAGRNRVMSKTDFLNIFVSIPSIAEQQKIAAVLNGIDKEIELLKKQLECLKTQKKGLMQKLLTGKIRVKV